MPATKTRWLALALIALGCILCLLSAADRYSGRKAPAWLDFGPAQPRQQVIEALAKGDFTAALSSARLVVSRDPMGNESASLLGSALLGIGRPEAARAAFTVAAQFGWRDKGTQAYWLLTSLNLGYEQVAAERLDALLRTSDPDRNVLAALMTLESSPAGRAALVARLAANPNWGSWYLESVAMLPSDARVRRDAVLMAASRAGFSPPADAVSLSVFTMLGKGEFQEAAALYRAFEGDNAAGKMVANAGFEKPLERFSTAPFAWRLFESGDVDVRRQSAPTGEGHALYVSSTGSAEESVAQQPLLLSPGRYQLSWLAVTAHGAPTEDVGVTLQCLPTGAALFPPDSVSASENGRHYVSFAVPDSGCAGQSLLIVAQPQDSSSQMPDWLDDIELRHIAG